MTTAVTMTLSEALEHLPALPPGTDECPVCGAEGDFDSGPPEWAAGDRALHAIRRCACGADWHVVYSYAGKALAE